MRNDKHTGDMMSILMGILNDECVGGVAAAGFDIIMRDSEQVNFILIILNFIQFVLLSLLEIIKKVDEKVS